MSNYIIERGELDDFPIISPGSTAAILMEDREQPAVKRAVLDFQKDIKRVTGKDAPILYNVDDLETNQHVILIGTIGAKGIIDELIEKEWIDVRSLKESSGAYRWEGFMITVINSPFRETQRALVIAGTDRRGTIYGLYDVSEQMGVSPWHYFADIAPKKKESIFVKGTANIADWPSVTFRGMFVNDEENLEAWSKAHTKDGTIGPETYSHIFELLLRLKGNIVWPAMHVNGFNNDVRNGVLADLYGVIMGSSHCDMLLRCNNYEWEKWKKESGYLDTKYDFSISGNNRNQLLEYWKDSIEQNKYYEVQWTVGMRGIHDWGFSSQEIDNDAKLSNEQKFAAKVKLLEDVIRNQRDLLDQVLDKDENRFEVFVPYKEVLPLYDAGLELPDDVTLLWVNDNHGYVRRYPNEAERNRKGGNGIYYHISYWAPRGMSYLWLNSIPLAQMKEELTKCYENQIRKIWILNVGSIKKCIETDIEFFIRYGWGIGKADADDTYEVNAFLENWINQNFSGTHGIDAAVLLNQYYQETNMMKLEHMMTNNFSLYHYGDEFSARIARYENMLQRAITIFDELPEIEKDAFFQTVLMKIKAAYYVNKSFYYADRSNLAFDQGRMQSANNYLELSREADDHKKALIRYFNEELSGGKWNKIMDPENYPPDVTVQLPAASPAIVIGETEMEIVVQDEQIPTALPTISFSEYNQNGKFIDIFNQGSGQFQWEANCESWIYSSEKEGIVTDDRRIWVTIKDIQDHLGQQGYIYFKDSSSGKIKRVLVTIENTKIPLFEIQGYAEADGYVSMLAEHYSKITHVGNKTWCKIENLGRGKGSMMRAYNPELVSLGTDDIPNAPSLEYKFTLQSSGQFPIEIFRYPTLDSTGRIRFAITVDEELSIIIESAMTDEWRGDWRNSVMNNGEKLLATLPYLTAGTHTLKVSMIDNYVTLYKMVIYTKPRKDTNMGPEESYHSKYNNTFSESFPLLKDREFAPQAMRNDVALWEKGIFNEGKGILKIEAEAVLENSEFAYTTESKDDWKDNWQVTQGETANRNGLAMLVRNSEHMWADPDIAPTMNYKINITSNGAYKIWILMKADEMNCDSLWVGIDKNIVPTSKRKQEADFTSAKHVWSFPTSRKWLWYKFAEIEHIPAGEHLLTLHASESGLRVDRIYLTQGEEMPPMDRDWTSSVRG